MINMKCIGHKLNIGENENDIDNHLQMKNKVV